MATITLTQAQIDQIKAEMSVQEEMMSEGEVLALARKISDKIDLPFVREEKEVIVMYKIIRMVDRTLYQLLPNEYYKLIKDATDGISREEAAIISERLTPLLNNLINIPVLTEEQEGKLIGLVLDLIVNAMVKGSRLAEDPVAG